VPRILQHMYCQGLELSHLRKSPGETRIVVEDASADSTGGQGGRNHAHNVGIEPSCRRNLRPTSEPELLQHSRAFFHPLRRCFPEGPSE
jgi:hypothetical protein